MLAGRRRYTLKARRKGRERMAKEIRVKSMRQPMPRRESG